MSPELETIIGLEKVIKKNQQQIYAGSTDPKHLQKIEDCMSKIVQLWIVLIKKQ